MKSKDITNKLTEWRDPMDMLNRGRSGPEMGPSGGFGGYAGGRSDIFGLGGRGGAPQQIDIGLGGAGGKSISRSAAKKEFGKEQTRTATMSPAQKQAEKEVRSGQYTPSPAPKKGEAPPAKREEPALSTQQRNYKELDRPAVQRKAEADKTAKDAAAKDRSSQPHYTIDPKTGKPIPANVQAQLQQKLQGKGFKDPEPGSISGFRPKSDKGATDTRAQLQQKLQGKGFKEPAKVEPAKVEPAKVEPAKAEPNPLFPGDRASRPPKEKFDKKSAAQSVGLHAALLAAIANMTADEKKSAAEKSTSAQQGNSNTPVTIDFIDPGSEKAADAPATTMPDSTTTTQTASNSGDKTSSPPVVVTAKEKPIPQKNQPEKVEDPTRKADQPKKDYDIAVQDPDIVTTNSEKPNAEADTVNDKESAATTQAAIEPSKDEKNEEDVLEKLRKLLGLDKNAEQQAKTEPAKEPAKEPEAKKDDPKPEPEKVAQDGPGKADAEKGDAGKRGDEKEAFPKFKRDEKTEKPEDTEKKGDDEITRKTDSPVNKGPAATGTDNAINWAPPPPERKYEPDERANRDRANLIRRQQQQNREAELQDIKRMTPDVNESLNHILGLANITKKEIVESTTMNLDMRQMIALLDEATKMADIKGKKHTGKYGKEYDTDEEGDDKPKAKEKNKRGRQESEATKDAKKWQGADAAGAAIIGGKAPSSAAKGTKHGFTAGEKAAKKAEKAKSKKNLKDWFDSTEEAILEGAKVDRMVKHIAKSERDLGKGKKEAENIAWATANKRGYLDNKNKKKVKEEKFTSNGKPISKDQYDALRIAAGKTPSPANVKEELKGGQKNLDVAEPKGKLDAKDFAKLRAKKDMKKKVKEGINFAEMMKETQMGIEEMLEELQQEIAEFKATGHMGDNLRDALDIHRYKGKDKLMGEAPMMQTMVEEPLDENPFTYAARQAKASGDDSFKLDGETFPVKEAMSRHAKGYQKYGSGMKVLAKLGREGASEEEMDAARKKFNKYDNDEKVDEDGPGAARLYSDEPNLRRIADISQAPMASPDEIRAAKGVFQDMPKSPKDDTGTMQNMPKRPKDDIEYTPLRKEPESDIFDREKPYRDPRTGKMVTPPKGLSISEPYGKKGYPDAVDLNAPPSKSKERKSMKENFDFSLWDNQLEKMINESLTVTTTQGDDEKDNSVSITASGEKAAEIMALLRNAGMDSTGAQMPNEPVVVEPEQLLSAYGVPMSQDDNSGSGHDDIVSLMQKLTGLGSDEGDSEEMEIDVIEPDHEEHDSEDYEEEDNEDEGEEEDQAEEDSDEEDSSDEEEKVDEAYGQADEGNAFTEKLKQTQKGDEFELDGKKYKDTSSLEEGMCQECGMNEAECGHSDMNEGVKAMGMITPTDDGEEYQAFPGYRVRSTFNKGQDKPETTFVKDTERRNVDTSRAPDQSRLPLTPNSDEDRVSGPRHLSTGERTGTENYDDDKEIYEEELANGADDVAMQDLQYLIKTIAGGLNKEKRDQTTLPHTAVKVTESREMLNEWKKLSGIK